MIFSIFRFFCTLRFQIYKYCPIITNHTSMQSYVFSFQMMHTSQFGKIDPYDWFCAPSKSTLGLISMITEKHCIDAVQPITHSCGFLQLSDWPFKSEPLNTIQISNKYLTQIFNTVGSPDHLITACVYHHSHINIHSPADPVFD